LFTEGFVTPDLPRNAKELVEGLPVGPGREFLRKRSARRAHRSPPVPAGLGSLP